MTRGAADYPALLAPLDLPAAAVPALAAYLALLDAWSVRVNLTGARSPAERVDLLVRGVLPVAKALVPGTVLDIGSGNGSPGLVLAALRPDLAATLLEPRQRRWAFLREAARAMGRPDVDVRRERHDQYPGPPASNVVLRALALPLAELAPLVAPGGRLVILGKDPQGDRGALVELTSDAPGLWTFARPRP
jgi:16S rRNA (guanine527-N7)-methyltransferase